MTIDLSQKPKPEFDFYDINPFIEAGAGEGYYFRWRGKEYVVECWATRNSGGQDIYEIESGRAVTPWSGEEDADGEDITDEIDDRFDEALEAFRERWYAAWTKHVDPALDAAKKEVLNER
jgi:hypothetical protein